MTRHRADSCAYCGAAVRAGEHFCGSCGAPNAPVQVGPGGSPVQLAGSCSTCGLAISPGSRFCGSCGTPIAQAPAASAPPIVAKQPVHTVHDPQGAAAADHRSAQSVLQTIAATRPDLWPALARNPACQADLLDWLRGQHDDGTDRAILERESREASLGRRPEPDDVGPGGPTVIVASSGPQPPLAQRPPLGDPAPPAAQSPPGSSVSGIWPPPNSGGEQMGWEATSRRIDGIRPAWQTALRNFPTPDDCPIRWASRSRAVRGGAGSPFRSPPAVELTPANGPYPDRWDLTNRKNAQIQTRMGLTV